MRPSTDEPPRDAGRVEAFSDAVIAISLTLMSVDLLQVQAPPAGTLGRSLGQHWPSYAAYGITYGVIGQIWLTHHNLWRYVRRVDQVLVLLNLALLLFVTLIPWAAKLLAGSLAGPVADQRVAAGLYAGTICGEALCFNAVVRWARRQRLFDAALPPARAAAIGRRYRWGPGLYLGAFGLAFVDARLSLASYVALIGFYLWPGAGDLPIPRQAAAGDDGHAPA